MQVRCDRTKQQTIGIGLENADAGTETGAEMLVLEAGEPRLGIRHAFSPYVLESLGWFLSMLGGLAMTRWWPANFVCKNERWVSVDIYAPPATGPPSAARPFPKGSEADPVAIRGTAGG